MIHELEMVRWAQSKEGTRVWYRDKHASRWSMSPICTPSFHPSAQYVVDDEYAEIRKAFLDGKTIQVKTEVCDWRTVSKTESVHRFDGVNEESDFYYSEKYRIAPKEVYKYQMLYKMHKNGTYILTDSFYESEAAFESSVNCDTIIGVHRLEVSKLKFNNE